MRHASYIVAALSVVAMIAIALILVLPDKRRKPSSTLLPRSSEPVLKAVPMPVPKPTYPLPSAFGPGDELAPDPERIPTVPMPGAGHESIDPWPQTPHGQGDVDKAAVKEALRSVPYKDCGAGGLGTVTVTFGPSGSVQRAAIMSGEYDGGTKSCIQNRFKGAKVPPFGGDPKSFTWSISL